LHAIAAHSIGAHVSLVLIVGSDVGSGGMAVSGITIIDCSHYWRREQPIERSGKVVCGETDIISTEIVEQCQAIRKLGLANSKIHFKIAGIDVGLLINNIGADVGRKVLGDYRTGGSLKSGAIRRSGSIRDARSRKAVLQEPVEVNHIAVEGFNDAGLDVVGRALVGKRPAAPGSPRRLLLAVNKDNGAEEENDE